MLGICEIIKGKENVILKNSTDRFFVYGNKIISYNKEHKLNYMVYSQNKWNSYTIATLNKDIELKKFHSRKKYYIHLHGLLLI